MAKKRKRAVKKTSPSTVAVVTDPAAYVRQFVSPAVFFHTSPRIGNSGVSTRKVALGLDLGTRCGYAYAVQTANDLWEFNSWFMGVWDLSSGRYDSGNIGFFRLYAFLDAINPCAVFYEKVRFTPAGMNNFNAARIMARAATASEFLGAMRQTMLSWCNNNDAAATGIPIGTIKLRATGSGRVGKPDVIQACNREYGTTFDPETYKTSGADNVADACWVLRCGLERYGTAISAGVFDGQSKETQ